MDIEFGKWMMSLGVGGAIAGFIFYFYRRDVKTYTDQWKGQSEMLMKVVQDNTQAISTNTEVTRSIATHLNENDRLRKIGIASRQGD